jgi:hypothetical protein
MEVEESGGVRERQPLGTMTAGLNLEATSVSFLQQPFSAGGQYAHVPVLCW